VLKEFPREIPNGFINGFKRTRNLPLGSFLGTCLPGYFGIGKLKERVRIYQKKTAKKILWR
jgi:hypothetical protein